MKKKIEKYQYLIEELGKLWCFKARLVLVATEALVIKSSELRYWRGVLKVDIDVRKVRKKKFQPC